MQRARALLFASVALAVSAGVALAARSMPAAASAGLATAGAAAGMTVSVQAGPAGLASLPPEAGGVPEPTEPAVPHGSPGAPSASPDNHGAVVSAAASSPTPSDFQGNHGQYVSSIARDNAGQAIAAARTAGHRPPVPGGPSGGPVRPVR